MQPGITLTSFIDFSYLQVTMLDAIEIAPFNQRSTVLNNLFARENLGRLCGSLLIFGLSSITLDWAWRLVPAYSLWISVLLMVLLVSEGLSCTLQDGSHMRRRGM